MLKDDVSGSTPKSDVTVSFDACSKPVSSGCGSLASKMKDMPLDRQNRVRGRVWPALSMTDYAVGRHSKSKWSRIENLKLQQHQICLCRWRKR